MTHRKISPSPRNLAISAALALAVGLLAGCPSVPKPPATMPAAAVDPGLAPVIGSEPTAGGVYIPLDSYVPLSGNALKRALADRPTILAATATQPATQSSSTQPASPTIQTSDFRLQTSAEPPPLAVKYYLQGREKFLDGANSQAMDFLDKALALDPNAFTVLRLMGRVCFTSAQLPRAAIYLQRAYALHPTDVEVNYLLGHCYLERKMGNSTGSYGNADSANIDRAVSHLLQADDSPERSASSAQTPLVSFYLARALQLAGYHKAAAAEYERFLNTISIPVAGYRYDRELNYLIDESWAAHLAAAENYVLVGNYAQAIPHYQAALAQQPADASFIISRLVNAQVHAGKFQLARQNALSLVTLNHGNALAGDGSNDDPIKLLAWSYRATGKENDILADLRSHISPPSASTTTDDPAPILTLAAAQDYLGKKSDAFDTLANFLAIHPTNLDVLERILKRVDSPASFKRALVIVAACLRAAPDKHDDIIKLFLPLTPFIHDLPLANDPAGDAQFTYLCGVAFRNQDDLPAAERFFRQAIHTDPAFFPARDAMVSLLLSQEKFQDASGLVQDALTANPTNPRAYQLLIETEGAQQRLSNALKIATDARQKFPDNPELRLQISAIYRLRGEDDLADRELVALVEMAPKFEPAYHSLINALLARAHNENLSEADRQRAENDAQSYLVRLSRALPNSMFARITSAILAAREGRFVESESLLRRLLVDHPDEPEILIPLAQLRQVLGHPADAAATLEEPLKKHPNPELAAALVDLYRDQERPADSLALTERLMKDGGADNPAKESFIVLHASELFNQKNTSAAIDVLNAAIEKSPRSEQLALSLARIQSNADPAAAAATMQAFIARNGQTAGRLYTLSHFQSAAGQEAAAESSLQHVLDLMPDHTGANNDLAYFWTDANKNLALSEPMIKKALDNEPNNAAYLDSLGWLYYKQGRFAQAIPFFEKSITLPGGMEPEVVQHLADALYRNGRKPEAGERYRQAQNLVKELPTPLNPEHKKIKTYLDAALAAIKRGKDPALSPIAAELPAATSPATAPLTTQAPTTQNLAPH